MMKETRKRRNYKKKEDPINDRIVKLTTTSFKDDTFSEPEIKSRYFNPKTKKYVTVDRQSYTLTVEGGVNGTSSTVVLNNITKEDVSFIGKDILYIKTSLNNLKSSKQSFFRSYSFISLLIFPIVLVIIALILVILLRKSIIKSMLGIFFYSMLRFLSLGGCAGSIPKSCANTLKKI